jgi:putative membrane protein
MFRRLPKILPVVVLTFALLGTAPALPAEAKGSHHGHNHQSHDVSGLDEFWLQSSIQGDRFEIQGGQLAQQKGATQGVRDYGARLVTDHTKSLNDAIALAQRFHIQVPDQPTPTQQWQLQEIQNYSGSAFDQHYLSLEVADHQQDIDEAETEADKGKNHEIKSDARDEIPTLQEHLAIAQQLLQQES